MVQQYYDEHEEEILEFYEPPYWDSLLPYLEDREMNWKKWIKYNPYKKLWALIGGRPWTYIIRDTWHKAEILWIFGLVSLGVWLGHHFDWKLILIGWAIFIAGYCFGHFFWSSYIPNQPGE